MKGAGAVFAVGVKVAACVRVSGPVQDGRILCIVCILCIARPACLRVAGQRQRQGVRVCEL